MNANRLESTMNPEVKRYLLGITSRLRIVGSTKLMLLTFYDMFTSAVNKNQEYVIKQ